MNVLAIETSMGQTSVALAAGQGSAALIAKILDGRHTQAERLTPLIQDLMTESGTAFSDLDRIAVCVGPGGFSSIRTGVAAARGLGLAAEIPVVGATSFRLIAEGFENQEALADTYGILAPAGLDSMFCQILQPGAVALTPIALIPRSECQAFFAGKVSALVGPGASAIYTALEPTLELPVLDIVPDATILATIAPGLDPTRDPPSPYYVREADARPQTKHFIAKQVR